MGKIEGQVKICHVTSGHSRYDGRIFKKECHSLSKKGYEVFLIVNDEFDNEENGEIKIYSTKFKPKNRFERMVLSLKKIKQLIEEVDADIYHLHDSELLLLVNFIKGKNKKVIFDSHEDYLNSIDDKNWIPKRIRFLVKELYRIFEKNIISKLDAAIVCYHSTEKRYIKNCKKVKMVLNFPIISNKKIKLENNFLNKNIVFAGLISEIWCHENIIKACSQIEGVKYKLAGNITSKYGEKLREMEEWKNVDYYGKLTMNEVYQKIYCNATAGVALLDYISMCEGNIGNLSNTKLFEFMHAGLPVICTDFILWKEIIENYKCGICVNPHNIEEIKKAINKLVENPELCKEMGINGQKAVFESYNWSICEKELFEVYDFVLREFI